MNKENSDVMDNMDVAKEILSLLKIGPDDPAMLAGLKDACAECDKYGPPKGKPCAALRLALDCGCHYTPPEWCRDTSVNPQ